ncbi:putative amidoligase enzyme-domain-containing protein [Daldinia bambusicola]|nr:putative amidoligase enzyme-domain-containing protein [Daldinia bambusicola]
MSQEEEMSDDIKSSFGVELEFLIAVRRPGPRMRTPRMFQLSKGWPIEPKPGSVSSATFVQNLVQQVIDTAVQGYEGDRVITKDDELDDVDGNHLKPYTAWSVGRDLSVRPISQEKDMNGFLWQDLEIRSPALFATDESFAEVHYIVTVLYNNFWIYAPETAGLHIHYGRGKEWIPVHHLRRIAAFLFAADPILTQMHPSHRRERGYRDCCPSNRYYSVLAHGISTAQVSTNLSLYLDEGHHEEVLAEDSSGSKPGETGSLDFTTIFKRGTLEGYSFDRRYFTEGNVGWAQGEYLPGRRVDKPIDIVTGARKLLSAPNALVVSALMQNRVHSRSAYNFMAYNPEGYGAVQLFGITRPPAIQRKRTIEFRQAAGTVDADEVVAHARIAVRLAEFACEIDMNSLWRVILELAESEVDPKWYDIFDLLSDLGLGNEARFIQRQMARHRGIKIINEDLGTFEEPPASPSSWSKFKSWLSPPPSPIVAQEQPKKPETKADDSVDPVENFRRSIFQLYR